MTWCRSATHSRRRASSAESSQPIAHSPQPPLSLSDLYDHSPPHGAQPVRPPGLARPRARGEMILVLAEGDAESILELTRALPQRARLPRAQAAGGLVPQSFLARWRGTSPHPRALVIDSLSPGRRGGRAASAPCCSALAGRLPGQRVRRASHPGAWAASRAERGSSARQTPRDYRARRRHPVFLGCSDVDFHSRASASSSPRGLARMGARDMRLYPGWGNGERHEIDAVTQMMESVLASPPMRTGPPRPR